MMISFNSEEQVKVPFETNTQGNVSTFVCGQSDVNQLALPVSAKIVPAQYIMYFQGKHIYLEERELHPQLNGYHLEQLLGKMALT